MNDSSTISNHLAALDRPKASPARRRRWQILLPILGLPLALLLLLALVFREQLRPAVEVETAPVLLLELDGEASAQPGNSEMLFQASGWVEPDPWAVRAAVQVDGFVREVRVREGDLVAQGQVLARLDDTDTRLLRDRLALETRAATENLKAEEAARDAAKTRQDVARAQEDRARAGRVVARDRQTRLEAQELGDTSPAERVATRQALVEQESRVIEAEANLRHADLELRRQEALLAAAKLNLQALKKRLKTAAVNLDRCEILAPISGRVLKRYVEPGAKRRAAMDDVNSATIVTLYDPAKLQVRVDVPLTEAGQLAVDQPARVVTALLGGQIMTGRVSRIVGEADIARNTLQAKVELSDPDPRLRPETLCRVEFWSHPEPSPHATSSGGRGLWLPQAALSDPEASQCTVWVVDPVTHTASPVEIKVSPAKRGEHRRVLEGLHANQRVVIQGANNLNPGVRVRSTRKETP